MQVQIRCMQNLIIIFSINVDIKFKKVNVLCKIQKKSTIFIGLFCVEILCLVKIDGVLSVKQKSLSLLFTLRLVSSLYPIKTNSEK